MFTKLIATKDDAIAFLNELSAEGRSYHPDDDPREIIYADGTRVFTDEEAQLVNDQMGRCFDLLGDDVYDALNDADHAKLGMVRGEDGYVQFAFRYGGMRMPTVYVPCRNEDAASAIWRVLTYDSGCSPLNMLEDAAGYPGGKLLTVGTVGKTHIVAVRLAEFYVFGFVPYPNSGVPGQVADVTTKVMQRMHHKLLEFGTLYVPQNNGLLVHLPPPTDYCRQLLSGFDYSVLGASGF